MKKRVKKNKLSKIPQVKKKLSVRFTEDEFLACHTAVTSMNDLLRKELDEGDHDEETKAEMRKSVVRLTALEKKLFDIALKDIMSRNSIFSDTKFKR